MSNRRKIRRHPSGDTYSELDPVAVADWLAVARVLETQCDHCTMRYARRDRDGSVLALHAEDCPHPEWSGPGTEEEAAAIGIPRRIDP